MPPAALDQLDSRPARKEGLVAELIDEETVVYDPETDQLHHLDRSATAVWRRLDGSPPLRSVAGEIATAYGVAEEVARRDVCGLAVALRDRGLLAGSVAPGRPAAHQPAAASELEHDQPLQAARHTIGPFRGLRHSFRITTSDQDVASYLDGILVDLRSGDAAGAAHYELVGAGAQYVVRYNDDTVVVTGRADRAVAVLLWHINAEVVRCSTPHYPVVHAAAAVKHGASVLLPAAPSSGKTTTVAGLVSMAGFGYISDEAVGIDPATLLPQRYPKPMSIDRGSWPVLPALRPTNDLATGQWQVPARSIRPDSLGQPAPIRFVVEPCYDPDAKTSLEPVTCATMLMTLADSAFNFPSAPARNLRVLARVVESAACYRLPISDLDRAVALINDLCSSSVRAETTAV